MERLNGIMRTGAIKKMLTALLLLLMALLLTGCSGSLSEKDIRGAQSFGAFSDEGVVVIKTADGKYGYINYKGETVAMPQWDYAEDINNGAAVVRVDGEVILYGGVTFEGQLSVPVEYNKLEWFPSERVFVGMKKTDAGERYYLISRTGSFISEGQWDEIGRFYDGRAAVKKDGKWGVIDTAGKVIVQPQYGKMYVDGETMWTYIDGELCRIDASGKVLHNASTTLSQVNTLAKASGVTVSFSGTPYVTIISDDAIAVSVSVKTNAMIMGGVSTYAILTDKGVTVPLLADGYATQWINAYSEDSIILTACPMKMGGTYGNVLEVDTSEYVYAVVKADGTVVVKPGTYKYIDHLHDSGMYYITRYSNKGMMKPNGEVVLSPSYSSIEPMHENLAAFKSGSSWGYINRQGQVVIPAQYEKAGCFGGSYAAVKIDGEWHFIDKTGRIIY